MINDQHHPYSWEPRGEQTYDGSKCVEDTEKHVNTRYGSNYNRANDVAVWPCVWQPTPKTADVTVTKIAGYVRVRILMNR